MSTAYRFGVFFSEASRKRWKRTQGFPPFVIFATKYPAHAKRVRDNPIYDINVLYANIMFVPVCTLGALPDEARAHGHQQGAVLSSALLPSQVQGAERGGRDRSTLVSRGRAEALLRKDSCRRRPLSDGRRTAARLAARGITASHRWWRAPNAWLCRPAKAAAKMRAVLSCVALRR